MALRSMLWPSSCTLLLLMAALPLRGMASVVLKVWEAPICHLNGGLVALIDSIGACPALL